MRHVPLCVHSRGCSRRRAVPAPQCGCAVMRLQPLSRVFAYFVRLPRSCVVLASLLPLCVVRAPQLTPNPNKSTQIRRPGPRKLYRGPRKLYHGRCITAAVSRPLYHTSGWSSYCSTRLLRDFVLRAKSIQIRSNMVKTCTKKRESRDMREFHMTAKTPTNPINTYKSNKHAQITPNPPKSDQMWPKHARKTPNPGSLANLP